MFLGTGPMGFGSRARIASKLQDKPSQKDNQERFAKLPTCHLPHGEACRFQRQMEGERRCVAVLGLKIECPHLGTVEPIQQKIIEKQQDQEKLQILVEPAPSVDRG